jgi:hypothetical protein
MEYSVPTLLQPKLLTAQNPPILCLNFYRYALLNDLA